MEAVLRVFCATFFLVLIGKGMSQGCPPDSISIEQSRTGNFVKGKPEFAVTVRNECDCSRENVRIYCSGFQTVEEPNHYYLTRSVYDCLLIEGKVMDAFGEIDFVYAWDTEFPFKVLSSITQCPLRLL